MIFIAYLIYCKFQIDPKDLDKKPTKEEYAIAKYLKQKLPEKKTTLLGHKVEYFIGINDFRYWFFPLLLICLICKIYIHIYVFLIIVQHFKYFEIISVLAGCW